MMLLSALILVAPIELPPLPNPELISLLREARQSAPELAVVTARLERARVAERAAGAERRARVEAQASTGRARETGASGELETRSRHRASFELNWEIDLWGRLAQARSAAQRDAEAAAEDLRGAWLLLESEVVDTFLQFRFLEAAMPHHAARMAAVQHTVALHEARAEAGVGTRTSVHQARVVLRQIETESLAHQRALTQARQRLALLLGRPPEWTPPSGPALDLPELPSGVASTVLEARPDLRAAQHRLEAATNRVNESRAARLPRFTLTGAYGMASSELRNLSRESATTWSVFPSLSVPLLDGGRSKVRVEAAEAEALEAEALLCQLQHRALHEVADTLELIMQDREVLAHWSGVERDAGKLLSARQAEKHAGRIGGLLLAEAEVEQHGAALQSLEARKQLAQTRVVLQRALGQSWIGAVDAAH